MREDTHKKKTLVKIIVDRPLKSTALVLRVSSLSDKLRDINLEIH